ncbi:MAG: fumarylacetoacetate hydrolase family protein [Candidatus Eisenbacteria bacterium]|nr:fumarylacetoacetate hydrolase family protein [Candidatus Eisenbacteria bacterium]
MRRKLASIGAPGSEAPVWIDDAGDSFLPAEGPSWRRILEAGGYETERRRMLQVPREAWQPLGGARFGPPIPDPSKIVAVGLNYRDHAEEQGKKPPESPLLFAKAPSCLAGHLDPIGIPPQEGRVDAEAELGVVIARRTRRVTVEQAQSCVLGYMIFNDVSGREAQYGDKQWFRGKSFDTFGPCGPWIVPAEAIGDPHALAIRAFWNDVKMQESRTDRLLFGVFALISYVSMQMTLEPGDVLATGTPSGVGVFRDPPVFLKPGDRVRIEIEGIGSLENPVEAER